MLKLSANESPYGASPATVAALADLRRLSLCLFAQMLEHRWLAAQLIHAGPDEEQALRTWERTGQILRRMELSTTQQFHASLAITNYASGMGAEVSQRQDQAQAADYMGKSLTKFMSQLPAMPDADRKEMQRLLVFSVEQGIRNAYAMPMSDPFFSLDGKALGDGPDGNTTRDFLDLLYARTAPEHHPFIRDLFERIV